MSISLVPKHAIHDVSKYINIPEAFNETIARTVAHIDGKKALELLLKGEMQLWIIDKVYLIPPNASSVGGPQPGGDSGYFALCFTEIHQTPLIRVLNVAGLYGDNMDRWQTELDRCLVDFARRNKCDYIECWVRPGLKRKLAPFGYQQQAIVLSKDVKLWAEKEEEAAAPQ